MSEKIEASDSCIIVDMLDNGAPHTGLASHSSVGAQKPVQVVPPTPVVRQAASPSVIPSTSLPQPSPVNFAVSGQPLLQQNVNIMNINLPTASGTAPAVTSTPPTNSSQAATLIQLPDGRLLLQQAAPTFAFVSGPVQGAGQSIAITVPSTSTVGGCQHQPAVHIVQQPVNTALQQQTSVTVSQSVTMNSQPATTPCTHVVNSGIQRTAQQIKPVVQTVAPPPPQSSSMATPRCSRPTVVTTAAATTSTSVTSSGRPAASRVIHTGSGTLQLPSNMPPEELRRKIEMQIGRLRALANPGPKEKLMLQRLTELLEQIPVPAEPSPAAEVSALLAGAPCLMSKPGPNEETLLVEFRVPGQRLMLRLSRTQKTELEALLAKASPEVHQRLLATVHERQTSPRTPQQVVHRARKIPTAPTVVRADPQTSTSSASTSSASTSSASTSAAAPQSKSASRTAQQVVLTPQMRRSLQIRRQLQTEQQKAACPTTTEPFRLVKEAAIALMKYHVYQDIDNSDHAASEVDTIIHEAYDLLERRKRELLAAVHRIERRCVTQRAPIAPEEGGPNAEEAYVITNMALDLERDTLEEERRRFQERPRSFQPLTFDLRTGKANPVPLLPPPCEELEEAVVEQDVRVKNDEEEEEDKADVWESFLEAEKQSQLSEVMEPLMKRQCMTEESETDRAVAAIMGETGLSSWTSSSSSTVIHSEDPDVDAAIRSIM